VVFAVAIVGAFLLLFPLFANNYLLSLAILVLYLAYVGQAWNLMMGFAGQLSLGHALYLGLGAYSAGALYFHFGVGPWAGMWLSLLLSLTAAASLGFLAFRYRVAGVYFTLLTIAFAEFARIAFDHFAWTGGSGGLFLKVAQRDQLDPLNLRGPPLMFYYVILGLAAAAFALCFVLLRSRAGYYWQAIREDEAAAQALGIHAFAWKMLAILISGGMTSLAGVFWAFYYNNLFPEQIFSIGRSIEIMLGPVIGGIGTLAGPIIGAAFLTLLADGTTELVSALGWDIAGLKHLVYGTILLAIIILLPRGLWPVFARRLGLHE
jgi:branched-chain amino acid transport system permease protein